jgi:AraC family transcriptional regulator
MNPAEKALWFIESHLAGELTLEEVAAIAGISRFHMVRAFAAATGLSVMRYVRARRLSEAARALANGAPDILTVALDADYGSHEAFTRAFRDHFGVTPEAVRGSAHLDNLRLQEPIVMDSTVIDNLQPPRFETGKPLLVAGLGERYTWESGAAIPGQWQRFHQSVANFPGRIGKVAYGVCCNGDDAGNYDYIAGVEGVRFFRSATRIQPRPNSGSAIRGVFPSRSHLDHTPHHQHDLESLVAGLRPKGGRRAEFRALRRKLRFPDRQWRPRNMDPGQGMNCTGGLQAISAFTRVFNAP